MSCGQAWAEPSSILSIQKKYNFRREISHNHGRFVNKQLPVAAAHIVIKRAGTGASAVCGQMCFVKGKTAWEQAAMCQWNVRFCDK